MDGVSYQTMVDYVRSELRPVEEHMADHDNWHRDRLTAEALAGRANRLAIWAVALAAVTGLGGLILQVVAHR